MKQSILILLILTSLPFFTNAQVLTKIDEVTSFQDGIGAVKKDNTWGFINDTGKLVIDYRKDIVLTDGVPVFSDGLSLIEEERDGITYYGYINPNGEKVIPAEYLAATNFKDGYARVIKHYREETGTVNALGKDIVNYSYNELLIDSKNKTVQHLRGPIHLLFDLKQIKKDPPVITSKFLSDNLIAVLKEDNTYSIFKLDK